MGVIHIEDLRSFFASSGHPLLAEAPKSYDYLIHLTFRTRSPCTFRFDLSDAGKRCYFCLRWENTRGEKGPWSEIISAVVP
ncbi:MAG: hypothetical protein LBR08_09835 [Bacteroidales bacterium]|nr:hypothetical protein [Bacteroidales bacterium]